MVGFEDSVNMVEECRDPARIFPRSLLSALAAAALIYGLVALTASLLVPAEELSAAKSDALLKVVATGAPAFPLKVFAGIGLLAVINSALINLLMASRLLYGMANERILPRVFGFVHPSRRTPWVSILFTTAIAVGLVVIAGEDGVKKLGGTTALLLLYVFTGSTSPAWCCAGRGSSTRTFGHLPGHPCWAPSSAATWRSRGCPAGRPATTRSRSFCWASASSCGASTDGGSVGSSSARRR
jgi:amino acid transporter